MKLFVRPKATPVIRVRIYQQKQATKYITICDTTADKCLRVFKSIVEAQKLSPFQTGKVTNIEVREGIGSKNGKSKSISFKGLTTDETYNLIIDYINTHKMLNQKELRQYATEMMQICQTYLIGQHTDQTFIIACQRIQDYFSTLDNENNQNQPYIPDGTATETQG